MMVRLRIELCTHLPPSRYRRKKASLKPPERKMSRSKPKPKPVPADDGAVEEGEEDEDGGVG